MTRHKDLELFAKTVLEDEDYSDIKFEHTINIDNNEFRVDVLAQKLGKTVIVECGRLDAQKLSILLKEYDVLHISFDKRLKWFFKDANVKELTTNKEAKERKRILRALGQKATKEEKIQVELLNEEKEKTITELIEILGQLQKYSNMDYTKIKNYDLHTENMEKTALRFSQLKTQLNEIDEKIKWILFKVGARNYPNLLTYSK